MELVFLAPIIFICLFILYLLSRHDFVLLRQNISLGQVFDAAIFVIISAFLFSRFFYVLNSGNFELFNILAFLHLAMYPGLSGLGFLIGGVLALHLFFRKKKGIRRIYDIFTISFIPVFGFNLLIKGYPAELFYVPLSILIFMLILFIVFIKIHNKYLLRDGTISFMLVFLVAANTLATEYLNPNSWSLLFGFTILQVIAALFFVTSFALIILNQKFFKS